MTNKNYLYNGIEHFRRAYAKGRHILSWYLRPFLGHRTLLSLHELTDIAPAMGESYGGTYDILIYKIRGSENRNTDFSEGFLPAHSWMQERWSKIFELMARHTLEEPVHVFDYGGIYFVRDGHHRISVAKWLGRVYIRAHVTKLTVPFTLSDEFSRSDLIHFRKLVDFQNKTHFLTNVPGAHFEIRRLKTWILLEQEIRQWSPSWFERHRSSYENNLEQDNHDRTWYNTTYKITLDYVKNNSLHYLFPGWGDTDVVMEIIRVWNTYPDPDDFWIEEIYALFIKQTRRHRFFLVPIWFFSEVVHSFVRTPCDERCRFLRISDIKNYRPDFRLPADTGKKYWRKLFRELFIDHAKKLKKKLGRPPYLSELVSDWYDTVWLPKTEM